MNAGSAASGDHDTRFIAIQRAAAQFLDLLELDQSATTRDATSVQIRSAPYVTIEVAAALTGYSAGAIRTKIARGIWVEGREWVRAPDSRVLISMAGFERWVECGGRQ